MNSIHQILFDFDYTLADSSEGIIRCVNYALTQVGAKPADPAAIRKMIGHSLEDTFGQFITDADTIRRCKELFMLHADTGAMVNNTFILDGVEETLETLLENFYSMGIVSTKRRISIEQTLEKTGLDDFFDVIIGYEDVKKVKPDPEGIHKAIESLAGSVKDTLYVGDSLIDVQAAHNAGVRLVGVLSGTTSAEIFRQNGAETIIGSLPELLNVLRI